jgi:hypothetical protein
MTETWYVLENGESGDPREVAPDKGGVLRHSNGMAVAIGPYGPRSRGVDADSERAKAAAAVEKVEREAKAERAPIAAEEAKDMKSEPPKRAYKTREAKAG